TAGEPPMRSLWKTHAPLTAASLVLVAALAAFAVGLLVDPRTIAGAPAWLKPAKFAASIAIYGLTLVWMFQFLPGWPRTRAAVGWWLDPGQPGPARAGVGAPPARARHAEPLQRRHAVRSHGVRGDGRGDSRPVDRQPRARCGGLAPAVPGSRAGFGAAGGTGS